MSFLYLRVCARNYFISTEAFGDLGLEDLDEWEYVNGLAEALLPYGELGLFVLSVLNSSISPVPSEVVLIPLTFLNPDSAIWYAFLATLGSSIGAVIGYYLGNKLGKPFIQRHWGRMYHTVDHYIDKHGLIIVGLSGISPLPFKAFCIGAGVFNLNVWKVFLVSMVFRGFRYFSIALIIKYFGESGVAFVEENLGISFLAISLLILVGYYFYIRYKDYFL